MPFNTTTCTTLRLKKNLPFLVSERATSDLRIGIFGFLFFIFAMKWCPLAAKIAGSSVLCFKRLVHIGVWTFSWFVRPLLATILCIWEIWFGSNNRLSRISLVGKQTKRLQKKKEKKVHHHTDFEADLWPQTGDFFGPIEFQSILFIAWSLHRIKTLYTRLSLEMTT